MADRRRGAPDAGGDPFALRLADNPALKALYLDAEHEDGYHRDQNVFGPGVTIEDDMAVAVRYTSGATLTYHLTAYAPWEGYRLMVNGSLGRLELEVVESSHVDPGHAGALKPAALHGAETPAEAFRAHMLVEMARMSVEDGLVMQLAPLAGGYPAVYLGAPWWFLDSPEGMRRFRETVTETAGFYNTVGFVDDTGAFCLAYRLPKRTYRLERRS